MNLQYNELAFRESGSQVNASGMMLLVITSTGMDRILDEIRQAAVSDSVDKVHVGLQVIRSWEALELLLADERSRAKYWWPKRSPPPR